MGSTALGLQGRIHNYCIEDAQVKLATGTSVRPCQWIPVLFSDSTRGKIISVDRMGMDMRIKTADDHYVIQRVRFHEPVDSFEEAKKGIDKILKDGFKSSPPNYSR